MEKTIRILATWFGCGLAPKGPGTVGTAGAVPLVLLFAYFGEKSYMIATFSFVVFSIFVAHLYELGHPDDHDRSEVVIDEVAGFLITMTWLPMTPLWLVLGFLAFRLFDVVKPWPISWVDRRVLGGVGVVADDLVAGILSNIILQTVLQQGWLK